MDKLFISQNGGVLKKTNYNDIYFITRENSKTYLVLKDAKAEVIATLNYLSEKLENNFLRTHKSYIINVDNIDTIEKISANIFVAKFIDIHDTALITKSNMKIINERYKMI